MYFISARRSSLISFFFVWVLVIVLLLAFFLSRQQQTTQQKAAIQTPSVYYGVYTDNNFWDFSTLFPFEIHAGKQVAIVIDYQDWDFELNDAASYFSPSWMNQVRSHGSIPLVTWEPQNYQNGVNQPTYQLRNIYNGMYDVYLSKWAQDAKNWGHPFFLRFAHEMNGNWYPWDEQVNGNQPGDFVKAWRHVHDIFVANGATNVSWVWSPNIESSNTTPLAELYPGDSYVDWVGMDGYNFDYGGWRTFSHLFQQTYTDLQQIAPSKPIMVAEMASAEQGGSKASWITDAYTLQIPTFFPKIKAVIWFNKNKERDWRIESSASAQQAFAQAISSPYYAGNQFGELNTSPNLLLELLRSSSLSPTQSQPLIPLSAPMWWIIRYSVLQSNGERDAFA
jgi:beta-mannanase